MVFARSSRCLETGRRHQLLELVRRVDHHQDARAGGARILEPAGEQRDMQADQHVGRLDGVERALAAADRLDADLGPGRHGVDAHLVGVGADVLRRRKGRRHVVAARTEIAQQHDGLALAHVAEREFLAKQHRQLGVVQSFVHRRTSRSPDRRSIASSARMVSRAQE
jgi:hypothetical protein